MKSLSLFIVFLVHYVGYAKAFITNNIRAESDNETQLNIEDVGKPLILTPYLENEHFVEARNDALVRHREIPGIESYSGYFTVNKEYNSNLFFWFFPAKDDKQIAPLILWLTGGPGSTSLLGLFAESGPFTVTGNQTVKMRKHSWTRNHHMLYLDSPVDTGFSFTENRKGFAKTADDVGRDVLTFLIQFYQFYPELRTNELYIIGESLAGKFAPCVMHAIKTHNEKVELKINAQGIIIAGGVCDPVNQLKHVQYLFELGFLDEYQRKELQDTEDKIVELMKQKKVLQILPKLNKVSKTIKNITGFDYFFHSMRSKEPGFINPFIHWVVRPDVRKAMHVGNITFERTSKKVQKFIVRDMFSSVANYVEETLEDKKRVLIYTGQLDIMVTYAAMENYVSKLNWSGAADYKTVKRKIYLVGDELAGYVKSANNLTTVLIRNSGHMLPNDQPIWANDMITRFTYNLGFED